MSVSDGDRQACLVQVYPRLCGVAGPCCSLQVSASTTAEQVVRAVTQALGVELCLPCVLAEVRDVGGQEWLLEEGECPLERVQLWPRKAQERHPQHDGYYFVLRECERDGSVCYSPAGVPGMPTVQEQQLAARGLLPQQRQDVDDLCDLPELSEPAILTTLRLRFHHEKIYTYAGSILVAINPFKFLPIYNPKYVKKYEGWPLGALEPHVFAVADVAYRTMLQRQRDQCVLISGESGSGKTQSTNFLIHCLTALSQKSYASRVERTILGAGPVLEAFGNAMTAYNNNSSRFGKFIQLNYLESGVVRGAVVEKFLLEKSRLVSREKNERNYHVFYYLLAGASTEDRCEFKLLKPQEYAYLKQENMLTGDDADLCHEFKRLQQTMEMVGFLPPTKKQIFSMLSAILYLGNVTYKPGGAEREEGLEVGPPEVLDILSDLLQVSQELLVKALTQRKSVTANDTLILQYTSNEAMTARDSLAKSLYSALFDWIVLRINVALLNKKDMEESITCLSIGVLDIFGFENFQNNSFEQFCINYANEQLQYYFNQHIFRLEQEEYQAEGIVWSNISYTDNVGCIHLISRKPTGLFHLLDEESNFPHATDKTLLAKFKQQHQANPYFVPTPVLEPAFVVHHFAGNVKYQLKDFREKNMDHMRADMVSLLLSSNQTFVRQLIGMSPAAAFRWGVLRATIRSLAVFKQAGRRQAAKRADLARRNSRTPLGELHAPRTPLRTLYSRMSLLEFSFDQSVEHPLESFEDVFASYENKKNSRFSKQKQIIPKNLIDASSLKRMADLILHERSTRALLHLNKKKKPLSISAQFQASLSKLMETLGKAEPFFIRCIRSNADKLEMQFDEALVLQQIRYTGMLETVRICRSGYSAKYTFQEFVEWFRVLLPKAASRPQRDITALLRNLRLSPSSYQIGNTKVFLKEPERQLLQETRHREVMRRIVFLQRWMRARAERKHFLYMRWAAVTIQRQWRRYQEEKQYRVTEMIQALWYNSRERAEYLRQRASFKKMQMLAKAREANKRCQQGPQENTRQHRESEREFSEKSPRELQGETQQRSVKNEAVVREQPGPQHRAQEKELQEGGGQGGAGLCEPTRLQTLRDGHLSDRGPQSASSERGEQPTMALEDRGPDRARMKAALSVRERPTSLPQHVFGCDEDPGSTLQRYSKHTLKDKAERWKERRNDPRGNTGTLNRKVSVSLDDVSSLGPSASADSNTDESFQKVQTLYRKRRIAHARSGMMLKSDDLDGMEYWSFPLPPMSPGTVPPALPAPPQAKSPTEMVTPDASRRTSRGSAGHVPTGPLLPVTSEKSGFLWKILRKRPHKEAQTPDDGELTPSHTLPATDHSRVVRNPTVRISRATRLSIQWNASLDREITSGSELRHLDDFLANQANELRSCGKQLSAAEFLFIRATMEFRENIKGMYSLEKPCIRCRYKDLMMSYQNKVTSLAGQKQKVEVQLVVNLFQSVLDGFARAEVKRKETEPDKPVKKKRRHEKDRVTEHRLDHVLSTYQVNIMQSCDLCTSYIWGMEKAFMCTSCKMVCHKKCLTKISKQCSTYASKKDTESCLLTFGVHVRMLTNEAQTVPVVVSVLLEHVELKGLYTEGIYRKSGSASLVKELRRRLDKEPQAVSLEEYPIHTVTGLLKQWLRELPEPLMTFTHYSDFLHAAELPERSEQLKAIYTVLERLPTPNFNTLERLMFHLVRVAKEEEHNRMSPNSLAIVFAPCVLRTSDTSDPLLTMKDVTKTTVCVELLLNEQMRLYKEKLKELEQLEYAEALAIKQLKLKRQNTVQKMPQLEQVRLSVNEPMDSDIEAENILLERIKSIKQEKDELTNTLPELNQPCLERDRLESEDLLEDRLWIMSHKGDTGVDSQRTTACSTKLGSAAEVTNTSKPSSTTCQHFQCPDTQQQGRAAGQSQSPVVRAKGSSAAAVVHPPAGHRPSNLPRGPFLGIDIPYIDDNI